jgi:hypothetical protein
MKSKVLIILCSLLILVSCDTQLHFKLKSTEILDIDFGNRFNGSKITGINGYISDSTVVRIDGELFNSDKFYDFNIENDEIRFQVINEHLTEDFKYVIPDDLKYLSLDEFKKIIMDIEKFLKNNYDLSSFSFRLFPDSHNISILAEDLPVYMYDDGQFTKIEDITQINSPCLQVYGNETALILLLD